MYLTNYFIRYVFYILYISIFFVNEKIEIYKIIKYTHKLQIQTTNYKLQTTNYI
jgi:hypothetical protein